MRYEETDRGPVADAIAAQICTLVAITALAIAAGRSLRQERAFFVTAGIAVTYLPVYLDRDSSNEERGGVVFERSACVDNWSDA